MKNFLLKCSIITHISFFLNSGFCTETEKTADDRFASFRKPAESGVHLLISDENIEHFLKATATNNPFNSIDTLTLTGKWSEYLVNDSLRPLFQTRITSIRQAVIYHNIVLEREKLDSKNSFVPHRSINSLIPKSTPMIKYDSFSRIIDPSNLYFFSDSRPKFLENLPSDLQHLDLKDIKLNSIKDVFALLPKSLVTLGIEYDHIPAWYLSNFRDYFPPQMKALIINRTRTPFCSDLVTISSKIPPHVVVLRFMNCEPHLGVHVLKEIVDSLHGEIEDLEISRDISAEMLSSYSSPEQKYIPDLIEDQITLDVTRLTKLKTLTLDGMPLPMGFKTKPGHVLSRQKSRNPIIRSITEGQDVPKDKLTLLPDRLMEDLVSLVARYGGKVITRNTLENLMQVCDFRDYHPETMANFYEKCHERGIPIDKIKLGNLYYAIAEKYETFIANELQSSEPRTDVIEKYIQQRDQYRQKAAQNGVRRLGTSLTVDEVSAFKELFTREALKHVEHRNRCLQAMKYLNDQSSRFNYLGNLYNEMIDQYENSIADELSSAHPNVINIVENVLQRDGYMRQLEQIGAKRSDTGVPFDENVVNEVCSQEITKLEVMAAKYNQIVEDFDVNEPGLDVSEPG